MRIERPIFIFGSHKSGSSLLRSLLDGHPALAVLPSESHFFQYAGYRVDYPLRRARLVDAPIEHRVRMLERFLEEENRCRDPFGASTMAGRYDEETFRQRLSGGRAETLKQLFEVYVDAMWASLGMARYMEGKRLVEKSVEHAEFGYVLKALFPDASFLHVIRNPYATFVALRRSRSRAGYPVLKPLIEALKASYSALAKNRIALDRYLIVRYEDLVKEPKETMRAVAAHLEIQYDECLEVPTLLGERWGGNSTSGRKFEGVDARPLEEWKNHIRDIEIVLVNRVLREFIDLYGYEVVEPRHRVLRQRWEPSPKERVGVYIKNRAYLFSLQSE